MKMRYTIGIVGMALAACTPIQQSQSPQGGSGTTQFVASTPSQTIPDTVSGALMLGAENAPVSMLLFTNHSCAYCNDFEHILMPKLQADFIATGKLKLQIIPIMLEKYPDSERNARTLICGVKAGSGSAANRMLFDGQKNFPTLASCMGDDAYLQSVMTKQYEVIRSLDVTLIPTYFIDGLKFTGLPEYADLRGKIQKALNL